MRPTVGGCFYFLLLAVIFVNGGPVKNYAEDMKKREKMGLECLKEVNLDKGVVDRVLATMEYPENPKYKDYLACSYKKQGYQREDGVIMYDSIKNFLERFYSRSDLKIIDNCKNDTGKSHGEMAFSAMECVIANLRIIEENSAR
ncbi:hypothetical protein JTB14_013399 [Gonioctena quinquepunctata]|nr:hypothetical protein JTB14_013399 [Gonioctena quinquepunctata]